MEDTVSVEKEVKTLLKVYQIDILINCAGVGVFEPHEELSSKTIQKLIAVNLTAPILLTNLCLRSLKKTQGRVINISSIEATRHAKFSALYTATKSGLRDFSLTLFEELRKSGVGVTSINPDLTQTNFFDNLKFKPSSQKDTYIDPNDIANIVEEIIRFNSVITDITIRPQKFAIEKRVK